MVFGPIRLDPLAGLVLWYLVGKENEALRVPIVEGAPPHEDRQQGAAGSRLKGWN